MRTVSLKDRRKAVVQLLALSLAQEAGQGGVHDEADADLLTTVVDLLSDRRKGIMSPELTDLVKRRGSIEASIQPESAINLALHALDCIAAGAHMDNRRLANGVRELRQGLLNMMTDTKVAPPPFSPPAKKGG